MEAVVGTTPQRAPSDASRWPKRSRARPLTLLDRRSVAARRIAELKQLFTTALADAGVNVGTPMRRLQIEQAASAMAVAESEAIVRAERRAGGSALRLRGHAVNSRRWRPTWRRGRRRSPCPLPSTLKRPRPLAAYSGLRLQCLAAGHAGATIAIGQSISPSDLGDASFNIS